MEDFHRISRAGFDAVRIYEMPDCRMLDAAEASGLKVIGGLAWQATADFRSDGRLLTRAHVELAECLRPVADHPALGAVLVGNEIPGDLVRWMGPAWVRAALEQLIDSGRAIAPDCLFGYASYPTTEYLELANADFTAMNVYLEDVSDFRAYLLRLHHVAGDRPLLVTEFGLDSRRNGMEAQARLLRDGMLAAHEAEAAGFTVYAWSDRWWNGREVLDWDFGLMDRDGLEKPALAACESALAEIRKQVGAVGAEARVAEEWPFSVIVCTRNGGTRIGRCLDACRKLKGERIEIIVVDDGSTDGTADLVEQAFPEVTLLRLPPGGLSEARNQGAAIASGRVLAYTDDDCEPDAEWIVRLRRRYAASSGRFAAVGGPNLPPPPETIAQAVVAAAPGAPSHVMLDDVEAEHLPGCNLTVTREAFDAIGGFDVDFHTAGDDVDFCWRLRDAGFRLGFAAGAFVWHVRRPTISGFLKQQLGYGVAEALLMEKHPCRFTRDGHARWEGFVYGGGPLRVTGDAVIYHGSMGLAGYQGLVGRVLPLRGLFPPFQTWKGRFMLAFVRFAQPVLRAWRRNGGLRKYAVRGIRGRWESSRQKQTPTAAHELPEEEFFLLPINGQGHEAYLKQWIEAGWAPGGPHDSWDLQKNHTRILLATERGEGEVKRVLVRIRGGSRASLGL